MTTSRSRQALTGTARRAGLIFLFGVTACTSSTPGDSAGSTLSSAAATTVPTTSVDIYFGEWVVSAEEPEAAWLQLPEEATLTIMISSVRSAPTLDGNVVVTLGCSNYGGGATQLSPLKIPDPTVQGQDCGEEINAAESRVADFVFAEENIEVDGNNLFIGTSPRQIVLRRSAS